MTKLKEIKKKINIHISHMIYEGRTTNNSDKINPLERAEVLNILSEEVKQFKAHLLQECIQNVVRDLPRVRVPASVQFFQRPDHHDCGYRLSVLVFPAW